MAFFYIHHGGQYRTGKMVCAAKVSCQHFFQQASAFIMYAAGFKISGIINQYIRRAGIMQHPVSKSSGLFLRILLVMAYKHLFFELDHTLWDFETNAKEVMYELYGLNGLAAKGITDFDHFFERYSYHNNRLWDRYTKGFIKQEELRWKRM